MKKLVFAVIGLAATAAVGYGMKETRFGRSITTNMRRKKAASGH